MRIYQNILSSIVLLVPFIWEAGADESGDGDEDGDGDGDEDGDEKSGDGDSGDGDSGDGDSSESEDGGYDDDGFFNFNDESGLMWSDYSIFPKKCITYNNEDVVVFSMHQGENNECTKKSAGTYYASVPNFVKAYAKQEYVNSYFDGSEYDAGDLLDYLDCTEYYKDDDLQLYVKVGCQQESNQFLVPKIYTDQYCTKTPSTRYSTDINIYKLMIPFQTCFSCVVWPTSDDIAVDDGFTTQHEYDSPLCSTAWYYRAQCAKDCLKMGFDPSSQNSSSGFSGVGMFFLFVLSGLGAFLLLAVLAYRKRMAEEQDMIEKDNGPNPKWAVLVSVFLIILFMILGLKLLTWISLIVLNVALLCYLLFLRYRATGRVEVGGFTLYSDEVEFA